MPPPDPCFLKMASLNRRPPPLCAAATIRNEKEALNRRAAGRESEREAGDEESRTTGSDK